MKTRKYVWFWSFNELKKKTNKKRKSPEPQTKGYEKRGRPSKFWCHNVTSKKIQNVSQKVTLPIYPFPTWPLLSTLPIPPTSPPDLYHLLHLSLPFPTNTIYSIDIPILTWPIPSTLPISPLLPYLYPTDATFSCSSPSSTTNGFGSSNFSLSSDRFNTCCEKFWLIKVASRARFVEELMPFSALSSFGVSTAVSFTVKRSRIEWNTEIKDPSYHKVLLLIRF